MFIYVGKQSSNLCYEMEISTRLYIIPCHWTNLQITKGYLESLYLEIAHTCDNYHYTEYRSIREEYSITMS
jgi:hypothetical protein